MDERFHWETRLHTLAGPLPPRKRLAAPPLKTTSLPGPPSLLLILSAQQTAHTSHDHPSLANKTRNISLRGVWQAAQVTHILYMVKAQGTSSSIVFEGFGGERFIVPVQKA